MSASFVATVWLGVAVVCFFNRRFGWSLSGLVVPGLLAPTWMTRPEIALRILVESILTYAIVRLVTVAMPRLFRAAELFGRDRFFAMLLFSVPVRLLLENTWGDNPTGIGLVVVPLLANQFWKPGLARGLWIHAVCVGFIVVVVRGILIPLTNFDLNNLSLVLDALNSRITDAPKAYIVLLTTSFLASQANLLYGWDLGGILFPALLALQFFDPLQMATTLLEAVCLFFAGAFVVQIPWVKSQGVEGAARLFLFFTLSLVYRLVAGHLGQHLSPATATGDFYGVGFLLSTMLAMRAAEKHAGVRILSSLAHTAVGGAIAGVALSLALRAAPISPAPTPLAANAPFCRVDAAATYPIETLSFREGSAYLRAIARERQDFFGAAHSESYFPSSPADLETLRTDVLAPLFRWAATTWKSTHTVERAEAFAVLAPLQANANRFGYRFAWIEGDAAIPGSVAKIALREAGTPCHRGLLFLTPGPAAPLALHVGRPLEERQVLEAGLWIFERLHARAIVVPTAHPTANADGSADADRYRNRQSFTTLAFEELVRATDEQPLGLLDVRSWNLAPDAAARTPIDAVWVAGELPGDAGPSASYVARIQDLFRAHGLRLERKDGSSVTTEVADPSFLLASAAARGTAVTALSIAIHPDSAKALTPVPQRSEWELRWTQFGKTMRQAPLAHPAPAAARELTESALPASVHAEIRRLLADGNIVHIARLQARWPELRADVVEDPSSGRQVLEVVDPTRHAVAQFDLHGHWLPRHSTRTFR